MSKEKLPQVYEENKKVFNIPESFITDNPNNYTLGEKLRTMYNNRHKEWDFMESQGRTKEHYERNVSGCFYILAFAFFFGVISIIVHILLS